MRRDTGSPQDDALPPPYDGDQLATSQSPPTKIMAVTRHKSLDTLVAYAHEVERGDDPAEACVSYNGKEGAP